MSTKQGKIGRHRFHGDPKRFEVVADYIYFTFGRSICYIADVAGGRGMLTRILNKKYNYESEVVDPRGFCLNGVPNRTEIYTSDMADYYDLIVGLHPDEATVEVVESAKKKPTLIIPCCNFWDTSKKLGRYALLSEIELYYRNNSISFKRIIFEFEGPKNVGLVTIDKPDRI